MSENNGLATSADRERRADAPLSERFPAVSFAFGRVRRAPAGERRITPFDPSVPSLILSAGLVALVLVAAAAFFDAISVPWARELPRGLVAFFQGVTVLGKSNWELIPSAILLLVLAAGDWRGESRLCRLFWLQVARISAYLFVAVAASGIAVNIAKLLVGRARPGSFDSLGPFAFEPFNPGYHFASFPSGHATTAGAVAVAVGLVAPAWRPHLLASGAMIAVSRVFVGAHYPSDVVAGFLFGGLCAYVIGSRMASRGFGFSRGSDDSIRTRTAVFGRARQRPGGMAEMLAGPWRALVKRLLPTSQ